MKVRDAKLSDLKAAQGKDNALGGPCFSLPALEMFLGAPDFTVHSSGESLLVAYHEGKGGKSRILLLVGTASSGLVRAAEDAARKVGTVKVTLEVAPESDALSLLEEEGYECRGEVKNYFGQGRPALFLEKMI